MEPGWKSCFFVLFFAFILQFFCHYIITSNNTSQNQYTAHYTVFGPLPALQHGTASYSTACSPCQVIAQAFTGRDCPTVLIVSIFSLCLLLELKQKLNYPYPPRCETKNKKFVFKPSPFTYSCSFFLFSFCTHSNKFNNFLWCYLALIDSGFSKFFYILLLVCRNYIQ